MCQNELGFNIKIRNQHLSPFRTFYFDKIRFYPYKRLIYERVTQTAHSIVNKIVIIFIVFFLVLVCDWMMP